MYFKFILFVLGFSFLLGSTNSYALPANCKAALMLTPDPTPSLQNLNQGGRGYAVLPKGFGLPDQFIERIRHLEGASKFPFHTESTFLVRDFENFDARKIPHMMTREVVSLFELSDKIKFLLERDVQYESKELKWILAFAEIRVDNNKQKYSTPHFDEEINDFVVIVPLTRDQGTLLWNPQQQHWQQAPVDGSPLIISTSKRPNPTLHQAPASSQGSAFILRYRLVKKESSSSTATDVK